MSWSVYVVGRLRISKDVDEETKKAILEDFSKALEIKPIYNAEEDEWKFNKAVWLSHITKRKVEAVYEKWKDYLDLADISLYSLEEPFCYIFNTNEG